MSPIETLTQPSIEVKTPWPDPNRPQDIPPIMRVYLAQRLFEYDGRSGVIGGRIGWSVFLCLAHHAGEEVSGKEIGRATIEAGGKSIDNAAKIRDLRRIIDRDFPRPLIKTIKKPRIDAITGRPRGISVSYLLDTSVEFLGKEIAQKQPPQPETHHIEPALAKKMQEESPLIQKAIDGDAEALGQLYQQYQKRNFGYFYCKTNNVAVTEDLLQTGFLRILENIGRFKPDRPFASWVQTIRHNLLVDHYRSQKVVSSIEDVVIIANDSNDPQAMVEKAEDRRLLHEAIKQLNPDPQRVVLDRYIYGMKYAEIAQQMGKSEGAVRVMLHRSLLALRALLLRESFI